MLPFHLPADHAHSIQVLNTCHALAVQGARVRLMVKRNRQRPVFNTAEALACYGLSPHERWHIEWLPTHHNGLAGLAARWRIRRAEYPSIFYARHLRLAVTAARARRGPVLVELHGIEPDTPRAVASVDGVVTITTALQHRIRELFNVGVPVEVIPHAFDETIFRPVQRAGPPRLVYTGQFYEWKGVDILIRALTRLPGVPALIIGGSRGTDPHRDELQALAIREGVAERVEWVGHLPQRQIPEHLRNGDIAVLPTRTHGQEISSVPPLKLFEYMACGLPVVAADLPSVRDVIRDGENGLLFRDGDHESLAVAVRQLLDSPSNRAVLATTARREAAGFTWAERARRILAFAERLQASWPRSPGTGSQVSVAPPAA